MKYQLGKISVRDTAEALKIAEAQLERPEVTNGGPVYVQVRPQDIRERLELFQPRRPGYGLRTLDTRHVGKLAVRIERKDMDPVLVVKLGREWVVVDGHHRLAAYRKLKHAESIKCEWFAGTVREATDESLRRNEKTHLEVQQGDKHEEAWKRTLLGWGSKRDVVKLTGCGDGTVAKMRRAMRSHREYNKKVQSDTDRLWGEKLHTQLGADLRVHAWSKVNRILLDLSPKQWDMNDAAARLANNITLRLTNKLSEDPEVTARALWLYDRDMYPALIEALQKHMREQQDEERDLEDRAAYEELEETHRGGQA
jgi:ParB-like nuclease family protein